MPQTEPPTQKRVVAEFWPLILLLVVAAFALLWKLGTGSLAAWDEAIYAEVSREIVESGNWLTLHWQSFGWFEKPPLFMWVTALFDRIFGISEFSARFPSALSGLALIAVTYVVGKAAYGKRVGLLAAVILLTCYHFLSFARFGTMEVMLTLFTYLAVYGYVRTINDRRWWYLVWSACAVALMIKGAGGLIAPGAIVLALIFDKRLSESIRSRHFWFACLLGALIVAPWHVLMLVRHGRVFITEYIGYHVIARATTTLEGNPSSPLYYVARLIDGFFPFILLAPFAIVSEIRNRKKEERRSWVLLALAGFVFLFFTMIPTRRPWYIVPLYPALAIIIAGFVVRFHQAYSSRPLVRRTITVSTSLLLIVGGLYSFASLTLNRRPAEPVAKLARLAQSTDPNDREPLLLFSQTQPFHAQVPVFYSKRPVLQVFESAAPASEDSKRYVNFVSLGEVLGESERRIILQKNDEKLLAEKYALRVIAEDDELVYGTIKRK